MPKPRLKVNNGLPKRWQFNHGAYYYRVPAGLESQWDGKKRFRLGTTLPEAYAAFAQRVSIPDRLQTVGDLLDRYSLEVVPNQLPKRQADSLRAIRRLRAIFGHMPMQAIVPAHIYQYVDRRRKPAKQADGTVKEVRALTSAHREIEVLSHAYTKAVQWGRLPRHPFLKEVRLDGDLALKPRDRHVEDWEVVEMLALRPKRAKGSVLMIQAYIRLKLLTGLARSDLLRLRQGEHLRDDGIHVTRHKTRGTTGKTTIYTYEQVPERRAAVQEAIAARPCLSPFLFCKRDGQGYFDEATGQCHGWDSMWSRFMDRVISETKVSQRFTEHDLRAKVGSDAENLERARALLQHASAATTLRIYRRKAERV